MNTSDMRSSHEEYRSAMLEHLHYTTLRHWDPAMRLIGAQSLKMICELQETLPGQALQIEVSPKGVQGIGWV